MRHSPKRSSLQYVPDRNKQTTLKRSLFALIRLWPAGVIVTPIAIARVSEPLAPVSSPDQSITAVPFADKLHNAVALVKNGRLDDSIADIRTTLDEMLAHGASVTPGDVVALEHAARTLVQHHADGEAVVSRLRENVNARLKWTAAPAMRRHAGLYRSMWLCLNSAMEDDAASLVWARQCSGPDGSDLQLVEASLFWPTFRDIAVRHLAWDVYAGSFGNAAQVFERTVDSAKTLAQNIAPGEFIAVTATTYFNDKLREEAARLYAGLLMLGAEDRARAVAQVAASHDSRAEHVYALLVDRALLVGQGREYQLDWLRLAEQRGAYIKNLQQSLRDELSQRQRRSQSSP